MVLLICVLWVGYDFRTAQSVPVEKRTIWVTFLHVVWYDKAALEPAENMSSHRAMQEWAFLFVCYSHMHITKLNIWGFLSWSRLFGDSAVTTHYHKRWHL